MTDSATAKAANTKIQSAKKATTSGPKARPASSKPNTLKSAQHTTSQKTTDRVSVQDKISGRPSGLSSSSSSTGTKKGRDGSGSPREISALDTSRSSTGGGGCGGGKGGDVGVGGRDGGGVDKELSGRVEANNNRSNVKKSEIEIGEDAVNNNSILDVELDGSTSVKDTDNEVSTTEDTNSVCDTNNKISMDDNTKSLKDTDYKIPSDGLKDTENNAVTKAMVNTLNDTENTASTKKNLNTVKDTNTKVSTEDNTNTLKDTDKTVSTNAITTEDTNDKMCTKAKANSNLAMAGNQELTDPSSKVAVKNEPLSEAGGNEGGVDTSSSCEDIPDRYSLEEERSSVAVKGVEMRLSALAGNWEKYFVRVGDWLVSATEGADSNPPSDHEEEGADAANKAGFASGLANFNLSGVSSRASASAKTVGSFFGTAFSKASASVKEAGSKIKETVEKSPLLSEFNKEQEAFIAAKGGKLGEALPPWVGYPEEDKLKDEILGLATERKNFVRNPPTGVIFEFDLEQFLPVAQATLAADPNLEKMRFELVPKVVTEEVFWRNYFYRVGLIRQSTELSSLEQDTDTPAKQATDNKVATAASSSEPTSSSATTAALEAAATDAPEFVSESFQPSSEDVEEVKRGISSLTGTAG